MGPQHRALCREGCQGDAHVAAGTALQQPQPLLRGALGAHRPSYVPPGPGGGRGRGQLRPCQSPPSGHPVDLRDRGEDGDGARNRRRQGRLDSALPRSVPPTPPQPLPAHFQCYGRHRSAANQSETALSQLVIGAELRPRPAYCSLREGRSALKGPDHEKALRVNSSAAARWDLMRPGGFRRCHSPSPGLREVSQHRHGGTDSATRGPAPTETGPVKPPLTREFAHRCPGGGSKQQASGMGDLPGFGMGTQRGHNGAGTRHGTRHDLHSQPACIWGGTSSTIPPCIRLELAAALQM